MPAETIEAANSLAPTITVRGQAILRAEPDEAMLWISLTALESDPATALTDVSRRSDALVVLLDDLGIAKKDRSTTGVTVYEEFDHTRSGRRSLGHRAAASVCARMTDPDLIGQLITKSTTELQARVNGPQWQIASHNPVRLDAAREAAADAKRKAQAFADGVGAKLGQLIRPIEPGEHEVTAAVDATFALKPA